MENFIHQYLRRYETILRINYGTVQFCYSTPHHVKICWIAIVNALLFFNMFMSITDEWFDWIVCLGKDYMWDKMDLRKARRIIRCIVNRKAEDLFAVVLNHKPPYIKMQIGFSRHYYLQRAMVIFANGRIYLIYGCVSLSILQHRLYPSHTDNRWKNTHTHTHTHTYHVLSLIHTNNESK